MNPSRIYWRDFLRLPPKPVPVDDVAKKAAEESREALRLYREAFEKELEGDIWPATFG